MATIEAKEKNPSKSNKCGFPFPSTEQEKWLSSTAVVSNDDDFCR